MRAHNADAQNKVHVLHARCTRSPHWSEAKPLGQQLSGVQRCLNPTTEPPGRGRKIPLGKALKPTGGKAQRMKS